ncbi:hypothetical protein GGU45_002167 [Niabella hirudinis]
MHRNTDFHSAKNMGGKLTFVPGSCSAALFLLVNDHTGNKGARPMTSRTGSAPVIIAGSTSPAYEITAALRLREVLDTHSYKG